MGFFGRGKGGGLMNVIRCDQEEYLVWKWRPLDQELNSTTRENSIRYGSSLRVKDGEVAVFVYKQKDGTCQDFIVGPYDDTIKTANFPVLSSIVGLAFGGESPFQAEIYFINLAGVVQVKFGIPYFDVADPRFLDFTVPVSAAGSITFNISDYKAFIKAHRLIDFNLETFKTQIADAVKRRVKGAISNAPSDFGFPVVQIERKIDEISDRIQEKLKVDFEDFAINLKRFDLSRMEADKESEGWQELRKITAGVQSDTILAQSQVNIKNIKDMQAINAENMQESLRIQREEAQRAQRLQSESTYIGAHALDQQATVLQTAAQNLGSMSSMGDGGGGMNPAGMMTGMMMGGAMGSQMAGMMNQMGNAMNGQFANQMNTPPPPPGVQYMLSVNGQQAGPFNMQQLQQLVQQGQLTPQTYVWKQGMQNWELAGNVAELAPLFMPATPPPPPPGMPPMPPAQ